MTFYIKGFIGFYTLSDVPDEPYFTADLISSTKADAPISRMVRLEKSDSSEGSTTSSLTSSDNHYYVYDIYFNWSDELGIPGAVQIGNCGPADKFFVNSFLVYPIANHTSSFTFFAYINSWIYEADSPRIFFSNKSYIPSQTPKPLLKYIEEEMKTKRGDGTGERKEWDRIYDYATYNDLGDPDQSPDLARPILGGSNEYPYPRRLRTGRAPSVSDPNTESRLPGDQAFSVYVPRDDRFSDHKLLELLQHFPKSMINLLKSYVKEEVELKGREFESFEDVREVLYKDGFQFHVPKEILDAIAQKLPIPEPPADGNLTLQFPVPGIIQDNLDGWMTDEEFVRELLAGVNPGLIRTVQEFPLRSTLDTNRCGDHTTKITQEQLEKHLNGLTISEALQDKRLFVLNHNDSFMPYLKLINETGNKAYATKTTLFLEKDGTLTPISIELGDETSTKIYLPATEGVEGTLWQLAKAYVVVNDTVYHRLVSHWLNTYAVIEPFIIATHRQLSAVHPIYNLLNPHFRNTLFINALARQYLISADGIIETSFLPGKFSMEMSSAAYKNWNFLEQALPTDLIKRGMAVKDPASPHGVRLVIKDYPFAEDGLLIWDAIKTWVTECVSYYYETDDSIKEDIALQSWWKEIVEVGHGDLKDKDWWPKMQTREELIESCTIIIWISSALHAAINFGQYPYGGYILNRPTLSRRLMPEEGTQEYEELVKNPELAFLKTITPKFETFLGLSITEIMSGHPTDEVYLGAITDSSKTFDEKPSKAFEEFGKKLAEIEETLIKRNEDETLINRVGPVKMPYSLLYPSSEPGLTGRGITNSISI